MRSKLFVLFSLILVFLIRAPLVQGDIVNGDFSSGLSNWTTEELLPLASDWSSTSRVSIVNGIAVLTTLGTTPGTLISLNQGTGVIPDFSVLSFDFGFSGGNPTPNFEFPDFFQVSFLDSIDTFPEPNPNDRAFAAIDPQGPYDPETDSSLILPLLATNLYHFTADISALAGREGILYFDLSNVDDGFNSLAYVDNVEITSAVPEPATLLLLGSGLVGVLGFARKRRSRFKP